MMMLCDVNIDDSTDANGVLKLQFIIIIIIIIIIEADDA